MPESRLQVGARTIRTFSLGTHLNFHSPFRMDTNWDNGEAIAKCVHIPLIYSDRDGNVKSEPGICDIDHMEKCQCGLYSFATVEELCKQYENQAKDCIAVVEPYGMTIKGSIGLRSTKVSILSVWIRNSGIRSSYKAIYPHILFYESFSEFELDHPELMGDIFSPRYYTKPGIWLNQWRWAISMPIAFSPYVPYPNSNFVQGVMQMVRLGESGANRDKIPGDKLVVEATMKMTPVRRRSLRVLSSEIPVEENVTYNPAVHFSVRHGSDPILVEQSQTLTIPKFVDLLI